MAETEGIKDILNQSAIQPATLVMAALRDAEAGSQPIALATHRKLQRQRYSRPILVKPAFNWDTQDRYFEFMNYEMEVMNILGTKAYEQRRKSSQELKTG